MLVSIVYIILGPVAVISVLLLGYTNAHVNKVHMLIPNMLTKRILTSIGFGASLETTHKSSLNVPSRLANPLISSQSLNIIHSYLLSVSLVNRLLKNREFTA